MWALIAIALRISGMGLYAISRYYRAAKKSSEWPCVPGELLKCELAERTKFDATVYCLEVRYSYHFDGEVLESTQVMFYFPEWSTCRSYYDRLRTALITQNALSV